MRSALVLFWNRAFCLQIAIKGVFWVKKRLLMCFLTVIFIISAFTTCFGEEITLNVLSDTKAHCVLATISDIDDNYVYAELYRTVADTQHAESVLPKILTIEKFRYSYCQEHGEDYSSPRVGDNIFATLKGDGTVFTVTSAAYRTDTVDERTLNFLAPAKMKNEHCLDDVVALAYYVRSNGLERGFVFDNGSVMLSRSDNTLTKLYPADIKNPIPVKFVDTTGKVVDEKKQQDVLDVSSGNIFENLWGSYNYELVFAKRALALGIIFAGIILGMVVVYFVVVGKKKQ